MSILVFNGSPSGKHGNCNVLIRTISKLVKQPTQSKAKHIVKVYHLADFQWTKAQINKLFYEIESCRGFIFVTGTYWDSWGSPLQIFLETITPLEATPSLLGKPAAVVVLNHSVGGKGILSRLQGVLSTLGLLIPPMSGLVHSWVSEQISEKNLKSEAAKDLWSLNDLDDIIENFKKALEIKVDWKSWPVDSRNLHKHANVWLKK